MKIISFYLITLALSIFFSSCGVNHALVLNHNESSTQVHLRNNNYQVLDQVSGSAEVDYIFLIGGLNRRQLYRNAYTEMVNSADLLSGSKALVNIVTEEHVGGVPPFYFKRTITVSAHVIEFVN